MPDINALVANQQIGNTGAAAAANRTLDLQATWNAGATVFQGLYYAVTNTASAAGSNVLELKVGAVSALAVAATGTLTSTGGIGTGHKVINTASTANSAGGFSFQAGISGVNNQGLSIFCVTASASRLYIDDAGFVGIGNSAPNFPLEVTGKIRATTIIATGGFTVATLPVGVVGDRAYVTDATAPTYNAVLTGGGAVTVPVFRNATVWVSA